MSPIAHAPHDDPTSNARTEAEGRVGVEQLADQVGRVGVEAAGEGEVLGGGQDLLEDLVLLLVLFFFVVVGCLVVGWVGA